jgi:hypothetical protein
MDYQGNILYTKTSYVELPEMQEILSSFPVDVGILYQAQEKCNQDNKDHKNLLSVALAYQYYANNTILPYKDIFIQESDLFLKKAQKISEKEKDYLISERIDLAHAQNLILKGNIDKGKDIIIEKLEGIKEENLALAYYILVSAFLQTNDKNSALKYYNELKMTNGGEVFVQIVRQEFE